MCILFGLHRTDELMPKCIKVQNVRKLLIFEFITSDDRPESFIALVGVELNWRFVKKNSSGNDWVIKAVGQGLLMEFEDYDVLDSKGFRKTTRQPLIRKRVQIGSCFPEVQEV